MRLVIQRVKWAKVDVDGETIGQIGLGLLVFLAIHHDDSPEVIPYFIKKLIHLRIFGDEEDKMNRSVMDVGGQLLVISQFTLYGNCLNGRRPDFIDAAPPDKAEKLYDAFILELRAAYDRVESGRFRAHMEVSSLNDGPVTFLLER